MHNRKKPYTSPQLIQLSEEEGREKIAKGLEQHAEAFAPKQRHATVHSPAAKNGTRATSIDDVAEEEAS
jgi:hypothetical protein